MPSGRGAGTYLWGGRVSSSGYHSLQTLFIAERSLTWRMNRVTWATSPRPLPAAARRRSMFWKTARSCSSISPATTLPVAGSNGGRGGGGVRGAGAAGGGGGGGGGRRG